MFLVTCGVKLFQELWCPAAGLLFQRRQRGGAPAWPCTCQCAHRAVRVPPVHPGPGVRARRAHEQESPVFLAGLLGNVDTDGANVCWSVSRYLQYHPINEFEPFFESIGLRPSELGKFLPCNLIYLNDAIELLENY